MGKPTDIVIEERIHRFKCHKVVHAAKIMALTCTAEDGWSVLVDQLCSSDRLAIAVTQEWMDKHDPKPGGYYVRYKDGYSSWSPAEAFENGYEVMPDTSPEASGPC